MFKKIYITQFLYCNNILSKQETSTRTHTQRGSCVTDYLPSLCGRHNTLHSALSSSCCITLPPASPTPAFHSPCSSFPLTISALCPLSPLSALLILPCGVHFISLHLRERGGTGGGRTPSSSSWSVMHTSENWACTHSAAALSIMEAV